MDAILVVNAGSSSLKFQIFAVAGTAARRQLRGQVDGIGVQPRFRRRRGGPMLIDNGLCSRRSPTRLRRALAEGLAARPRAPFAPGGRPSRGTWRAGYAAPVLHRRRRAGTVASPRGARAAAPAEQSGADPPVRELIPDVPQVACFDTAFHRAIRGRRLLCIPACPTRRRRAALWLSRPVLRVYRPAPARIGPTSQTAASLLHISAAAHRCARFKAGQKRRRTMGFTALDGLPMGTRPGQIDPGVVLYLIDQKGMTAAEVSSLPL